jgi:hypothetical protein
VSELSFQQFAGPRTSGRAGGAGLGSWRHGGADEQGMDGDTLEEVCSRHCRRFSSIARRLQPRRLPMSRTLRGGLWRSALGMARRHHLPILLRPVAE